MKKKALLSSILTIALCFSLVVGSTFALFTSESKTNVAVTSGTVSVTATASTPVLSSLLDGGNLTESSAKLDGNTVKLDKIVAGDKVDFNITVHNASDVTVKYRTIIGMVDDNGLWDALVVTIGGNTYNGATKVTAWETIAPSSKDVVIPVSIVLPISATSEVSGKTCEFAYTVEAVQGNADTENPDENTIYIYTSKDLSALSGMTISTAKTIEFVNDVDMTNSSFATVKFSNCNVKVKGNGHTVKGLCAPLFNFYGGNIDISELNVADSVISANTASGVLGTAAIVEVAQWTNLTMTDCQVKDVTVDGGSSRTGALVGYLVGGAEIVNCTVDNCNVKAEGSVAGIIGHEQRQTETGYLDYAKITNCTVKNSTFTATDEDWRVGTAVGTVAGKNVIVTNLKGTGNTLVMNDSRNPGQTIANPNHEVFGRIKGGSIEIDGLAYMSAAEIKTVLTSATEITLDKNYVVVGDWTPVKGTTTGAYDPIAGSIVIDGNGHSISGLTAPLIDGGAAQYITIKNLTIENSTITTGNEGGLGRGAFIAYADDNSVSVNIVNCTLKNSSVVSTEGAGAFIGYVAPNVTLEMDNCKVLGNCEIKGDKAGGLIGFLYGAGNPVIKNCEVADTVVITSTRSTPVAGRLIGRALGGNITVSDCTFSGKAVGENYDNGAIIVID